MSELPVLQLGPDLLVPQTRLPSSSATVTGVASAIVNALATVAPGTFSIAATAGLQDALDALQTGGGTLGTTWREWPTVGGVYPPRPATTQILIFSDPAVVPSGDGSLSGGGGGVPGHDRWINV